MKNNSKTMENSGKMQKTAKKRVQSERKGRPGALSAARLAAGRAAGRRRALRGPGGGRLRRGRRLERVAGAEK